jgi:hypothetical protein
MDTESELAEQVIATEESRLFFQQAHARDLRMQKREPHKDTIVGGTFISNKVVVLNYSDIYLKLCAAGKLSS